MSVKFTNNAETTLASGINSSVTSLTVASSTGFPTITTGEYFYVTLDDGTNNEIVKVTAVSGTTWTIVRAQDNTTARSFSSSNKVELRVTAGLITDAVADALASSFAKNAFTGDGTETNFTLSQSPNSEDDLIVFIEGVFQNQSTYSLSGTTLTFSTAPANTRAIVVYTVKAAVSGANLNHDQFTASGSAAFTLSIAPINENNTQVFIDGVYQQKTDYAVSGTTLTFDTAPASGAIVEVMTFTQTEVNVPATGSVVAASIANDVNLNGNPTTTTQSAGNNTTRIATTAFVEAAVSNLIDSAPNTMNTLNEIAAALGDDPSFTTTVNNAIATKLPLAGGTMTGNLVVGGSGFTTTTINSTRTSGNIGGINFSASGTNKAQIYGTVDGQLKLGTGGDGTVDSNLALTLDAAGKVGIGTASPDTELTIVGGIKVSQSALTDSIKMSVNTSSSYAQTITLDDVGLTFDNNSGSRGYRFGNNGSERMRIDSSGRVGIGTESPLDALHVTSAVSTDYRGNLLLSDSTAIAAGVGGQLNFGGKYTGSTYTEWAGIQGAKENATDGQYGGQLEFKTRAHNGALSTKMTLDSSGRVGIGTASPSYPLSVELDASATWLSRFYNTGTTESDNGLLVRTGSEHDGTITLGAYSGSSYKFVVLGDGKVGIGTTSPAAKLDIRDGGGSSDPTLSLVSNTSTAYNHSINALNPNLTAGEANIIVVGREGATNNAGYLGFKYVADGDNSNLISLGHWGNNFQLNVTGNGRVGIGTESPNDELDIAAVHSQLRLTDTDDSKFVQFSYSGGKLVVRNNSTSTTVNQFTITEDGKFGVGTISPEGGLHIEKASSGSSYSADGADQFILENSDSVAMDIRTPSSNTGLILFSDNDARGRGQIAYYHSSDTMAFLTAAAQGMEISSVGNVSVSNDSLVPANMAGLQVQSGGLLINGTSASGTNTVGSSAHHSNYWTFVGSSGRNGSASGSFRIEVPDCSNASSNHGYGGFSVEIYISGYNGVFCHAMVSGYNNSGISISESAILRSAGSHSLSYGIISGGTQGFYVDIDIPSYTHSSAYYRITKGGDTSSDHQTDFNNVKAVFT